MQLADEMKDDKAKDDEYDGKSLFQDCGVGGLCNMLDFLWHDWRYFELPD